MPTLQFTALALILTLLGSSVPAAAQSPPPPPTDLSGLWTATLRFGPDIRGTLIILRQPDGWRADIAGFSVPAKGDGPTISFELPDNKGSFRGKLTGGAGRFTATGSSPAPSTAVSATHRP